MPTTKAQFEKLIAAAAATTTHVLDLSNFNGKSDIADADLVNLRDALKATDNITEIKLRQNNISDGGAVAIRQILEKNSHIRTLDLAKNNINSSGTHEIFAALPNCSLTVLILTGNKLTKSSTPNPKWADIFSPLKDPNCKLHTLILHDTQIASALKDLSACLTHRPDFQLLDLSSNQITDANLTAFLANPHDIKTLRLRYNKLTDATFINILKLLKDGKTKEIQLSCNKLTEISCQQLLDAFKNVQIHKDVRVIEMFSPGNSGIPENSLKSVGLDALTEITNSKLAENVLLFSDIGATYYESVGASIESRIKFLLSMGDRSVRSLSSAKTPEKWQNCIDLARDKYKKAKGLLDDSSDTLKTVVEDRLKLLDDIEALNKNGDAIQTTTKPISLKSELKLHYDCTLLCQQAYKKNPAAPLNWEILDDASKVLTSKQDIDALKKTGYSCTAFYNKQLNLTVFAHRGTVMEVDGNIVQDLSILTSYPPSSLVLANKYAQEILKKKLGCQVLHTGHSLGAILAELMAYISETKAITFESPGSKEIILRLIAAKNQDLSKILKQLDDNVLAYVNGPNFINTTNTHIGRMIRIFPLTEINSANEGSFIGELLEKIKNDGQSMTALYVAGLLTHWTAWVPTATLLFIIYRLSENVKLPPGIKSAIDELKKIILADGSKHAMNNIVDVFTKEYRTEILARRESVENWPSNLSQYINLATYLKDYNIDLDALSELPDNILDPTLYSYETTAITDLKKLFVYFPFISDSSFTAAYKVVGMMSKKPAAKPAAAGGTEEETETIEMKP